MFRPDQDCVLGNVLPFVIDPSCGSLRSLGTKFLGSTSSGVGPRFKTIMLKLISMSQSPLVTIMYVQPLLCADDASRRQRLRQGALLRGLRLHRPIQIVGNRIRHHGYQISGFRIHLKSLLLTFRDVAKPVLFLFAVGVLRGYVCC